MMKQTKQLLLVCGALCATLFCANARAATYTVNSIADPGDGTCNVVSIGDGCTLRDAITAANGAPGADTITFDATIFGVPKSIELTSSLPPLSEEVIIRKQTSGTLLIWGSYSFTVNSNVKATVSGLDLMFITISNRGTLIVDNCTLSQDSLDNDSGAILNASNSTLERSPIKNSNGVVTLSNCTLKNMTEALFNSGIVAATNCIFNDNNQCIRNEAGAVTLTQCTMLNNTNAVKSTSGTVTITKSTFTSNNGGIWIISGTTAISKSIFRRNTTGVRSYSGTMEITSSVFTDGNNSVNCNGPLTFINSAICNNTGGLVSHISANITNSTFSGNHEGIINYGIANITNCTASGNGYGIYNSGASVTLKNTLSVGNSVSNNVGGFVDGGHNITSGTAAQAGLEVDAYDRGVARNNGGSTQTIALVDPTGTAVNAGDNSLIASGVTTDQRGSVFPRIEGGIVDIGAFESDFSGSGVSVSNARTFNEGSAAAPGSTTFTVSLSAASTQTVTVNYQTANGTATAGSDYTAKTGTLSFAPGEITKYVRVDFIGDSVAEANETFFLDLKTPANATIADSRGSAYIRNDDGPSLTISNAFTVNEGNAGTTAQSFTVTLSATSTNTVTVAYTTANGTAGPADYTVQSGTLTFAPGETSKTITVLVKGDTIVEPNETYKVNLSSPTYAVLADSQGVGYIRNDDVSALKFEDEPSE